MALGCGAAAGALVLDMEETDHDHVPPLAPPAVASSSRRMLHEDNTPPSVARVAFNPADPDFLALQQKFAAQECVPSPPLPGALWRGQQ